MRLSAEPILTRIYNHAESIPAHNLSSKICKQLDYGASSTWICRFRYNDFYRALMPVEPNTNSIVLQGVNVCSILELDNERIAITTTQDKILLFNNWILTNQYS